MDVKRGPILFRCDGTQNLSWEPLYQCLSLSASMQRRRRGTHFLSYLDPLSLAQTINRGNNDWHPAESPIGVGNDINVTTAMIRKLDAAAVIVAGNANEEYLGSLRVTGVQVVSIDSDAEVTFPSSIVVNPMLAPNKKAYRHGKGTQLLLGSRFALVRGLFRRQRTIRAVEQPGPFRALVAFGDDDAGDQTLLRTQQLLKMPSVGKVSIACRTHHPRYHELRDFANKSEHRVEVVTEPKELMTRLVRAHIALSSGDTWSMELCCVGIPQLLLPAKPIHEWNAKRLDDECVATNLGHSDKVNFETLHEAVNVVLDDPKERRGMSRCARNLIDGRGGDRVVNGLEILLHSPTLREGSRKKVAA